MNHQKKGLGTYTKTRLVNNAQKFWRHVVYIQPWKTKNVGAKEERAFCHMWTIISMKSTLFWQKTCRPPIRTYYYCQAALQLLIPKIDVYAYLQGVHNVWKLLKKSHSIIRAKRATFTFWADKSSSKNAKNGTYGEFLKAWSLKSNSVTRQVIFYTTKIGAKCQNSKIQMRHFD